jgi:predicted metal-dependent hydrolase
MLWSRAIRAPLVSRAVEHIEIKHAGEAYRVLLRATPTARRITLRVSYSSGAVILTMPHRVALTDAVDFAQRHAAWIGARLRRLPEPIPFECGAVIPLRDVDHRIVHAANRRGTVWVETAGTAAEGTELPQLCVAGDASHVSRRIADYLKRAAKQDLDASVKHYCGVLGIQPRSVTVRDTTSRWGSCSSSGGLNFSWRLIFAPAFVLDYLAAHEVAHLKHMNHSAKFWALTKRMCAETDRAEAWLNAHGSKLHRFGKSRSET